MIPAFKDLFHGLLYDGDRFRRWLRMILTLGGTRAAALLSQLPADILTSKTKTVLTIVSALSVAIGVALPLGKVSSQAPLK